MLPMNGLGTVLGTRSGGSGVIVTADLESFVEAHRSHGRLDGDTGHLTANGYRLTVACPCGVAFHRWITPGEVADHLTVLVRCRSSSPVSLS